MDFEARPLAGGIGRKIIGLSIDEGIAPAEASQVFRRLRLVGRSFHEDQDQQIFA